MSVFYKGLLTLNFRRWKANHYRQFERMLGCLNVVGIEVESFVSEEEADKLNRKFCRNDKDNYTRKLKKSEWLVDWTRHACDYNGLNRKQIEVHYIIDVRNPISFKKSINKLFDDIKGINLSGSLHLNVVSSDKCKITCALLSRDFDFQGKSAGGGYSHRFQSRGGIFSSGICGKEDLIRQIVLFAYLYRNLRYTSNSIRPKKKRYATRDPREISANPSLSMKYEDWIYGNSVGDISHECKNFHNKLIKIDNIMINSIPNNVRFFHMNIRELYGKIEE